MADKQTLITHCETQIARYQSLKDSLGYKEEMMTGECDEELAFANACSQARATADTALNAAVALENAAWESYWNCESP